MPLLARIRMFYNDPSGTAKTLHSKGHKLKCFIRVFGKHWLPISAGTPTVVSEVFCDFPQFQNNVELLLRIRQQSIHFTNVLPVSATVQVGKSLNCLVHGEHQTLRVDSALSTEFIFTWFCGLVSQFFSS